MWVERRSLISRASPTIFYCYAAYGYGDVNDAGAICIGPHDLPGRAFFSVCKPRLKHQDGPNLRRMVAPTR